MTGGRTTWRTSWWTLLGQLAVIAIGFVTAGALIGGPRTVGASVVALVTYGLIVATARWLWKVSVTPAGLEVSALATTVVPWPDIAAVAVNGARWSAQQVVLVSTDGRLRRLRAPTSFLGLGTSTVVEAATEIERWWHAHRDSPPHPADPSDETAVWAPPPTA